MQAVEAINPQPSWFKTTNRPTVKKQATISQPLQEVETNIRQVCSSGFSAKELCLDVPPELVNLLIGKKGVIVNHLEAESGARIQFSKGEAIARVTGTARQVLTARGLINNQIKKLRCNQQ